MALNFKSLLSFSSGLSLAFGDVGFFFFFLCVCSFLVFVLRLWLRIWWVLCHFFLFYMIFRCS
jgi:hypothetical protein